MYNGNALLRNKGEKAYMSKKRMEEYFRCKEDIIYFAENYFSIVTIDKGKIIIPLHNYQKKMLKAFVDPPKDKRNVVCLATRQCGKTSVASIFFLHQSLFSDTEMTAAILANKEATAIEILSRIKVAYQELPLWMQQGIDEDHGGWNRKSIGLENGVRIIAGSTASSTIRGYTIKLLLLDEYAFVPSNIVEEFTRSAYPTIASGESSKIIMCSTPSGLNHFYNIWRGAIRDENNFYPIKISWNQVPGRTEKWKQETIRDIGVQEFLQEFECLRGDSKLRLYDTIDDKEKIMTIEELKNNLKNKNIT